MLEFYSLRDLQLIKPNFLGVIFGNNLNGFWDFYHGNNVGVGSPKA
jgi:hypothetical protein